MTTQLSRPGAACGAFFAIGLAVAGGNGGFNIPQAVLAIIALSHAIPFICELGRLLRSAGPQTGGWPTQPSPPASRASG